MPKNAPKKAVKKEKAPKKDAYRLEISVNDVDYKGGGNDLVEALSKFVSSESFPVVVKTRAVFKYAGKGGEGSFILPTFMARRMFKMIEKKPSALELFASRLVGRLD